MYSLLKPILFSMDAEKAHERALRWLKLCDRAGLAAFFAGNVPERPVELMGLSVPNPVGMAAGMDKNGVCPDAMWSLGFGFVEVGTVTPKPQAGNSKPRLFRIESEEAILNRMGFNNDGIDRLVANLASLRRRGVLGVNIGKNAVTPMESALDDYLSALRSAHPVADYVTVNVSSPNTRNLRDLQERDVLLKLLKALIAERDGLDREAEKRVPLAVKIAPDLDDGQIDGMCEAFMEAGVDGIVATNTTIDKSLLGSHPLASEAGGLSGRPLRELSDRALARVKKNVGDSIDIIGVGGVLTPEDAERKLRHGAKAVQIMSGLIYGGPGLPGRVVRHLAALGDVQDWDRDGEPSENRP